MNRRLSVTLLACACLAVTVGCGGPDAPEGEAPGGGGVVADDEFTRLVGLPYSGFAGSIASGSSGVVLNLPEHTAAGLSLYASRDLCAAHLIDMQGETVRSWRGVPCRRWADVELLPDGRLIVVAAEPPEREGEPPRQMLLALGWDGREQWRAGIAAHHSVTVTDDGRILALAHVPRRVPRVHRDVDLLDSSLVALSPDGEVLESWSLYDALAGAGTEFRALPPRTKDGREVVDLLHPNAVDWVPAGAPGLPRAAGTGPMVLVTFRNQNLVALLDWESRRPVWTFGPGEVEGPHDGRRLPDGRVLVFDNGLVRGWSRVVEVAPETDEIVWEFRAPEPTDFFSPTRGGSQRLASGNTLVTSSDAGEAFEIGRDGGVVWRFLNPDADDEGRRATLFKMKRYDEAFATVLREAVDR